MHEAIEKAIDQKLGIPWDTGGGHQISEFLEHKAYIASGHTEAEWRDYSRAVDQIHNNIVDARAEKSDGKIRYMSPDAFLSRVPSMDSSSISADKQKSWPRETLAWLKNKMKKGEDVGVPFLDYKTKWKGGPSWDGRSRAMAAKQLGIQKIPVVVYGNPSGGKREDVDLEKAFDILLARQRALKWQTRGLDDLLKEEVGDYELKKLDRELNYVALEKKYGK